MLRKLLPLLVIALILIAGAVFAETTHDESGCTGECADCDGDCADCEDCDGDCDCKDDEAEVEAEDCPPEPCEGCPHSG
jgi:hypothetical protein